MELKGKAAVVTGSSSGDGVGGECAKLLASRGCNVVVNYAVNLIGNYQMCRAAAPHLKATGDGAIVNISSIGAMRGAGSSIAYAASKGALNTLTLSMARALAPEVRVNALCPGGLLGSWTRKIMTAEQYEARVRQAKTEFPLQRGVWPIDVARAALFLVEHAVAMTGECLRMDAGEHLGANLIRN